MSRILITGSSDGLGMLSAKLLVQEGHAVTFHARSEARAKDARKELPGAAGVLIGDLSSMAETRRLAEQANATGRFDAVIHNAAIGYREPHAETEDGVQRVFAVNVLAPYLLTALVTPPRRLVYLSSGMHRGGDPDLSDIPWKKRRWNGSQAYADSKLFDVILAFAVARRWPTVLSNAVEPGWVATKMGGAGAPDDLAQGGVTQAWLAVSDEPAATVTARCFFHKELRDAHPAAHDVAVQDALLDYCASLCGVPLPRL